LCVLAGNLAVLATEVETTARDLAEEAAAVCCPKRQELLRPEGIFAPSVGDISPPELTFEGGNLVNGCTKDEASAPRNRCQSCGSFAAAWGGRRCPEALGSQLARGKSRFSRARPRMGQETGSTRSSIIMST
jgi:hypothetical protein